jgi:hypothetical protein
MADDKERGKKRRKSLGFVKAEPDAARSADQAMASFCHMAAADRAIDLPAGNVGDDCQAYCEASRQPEEYVRFFAHNIIIAQYRQVNAGR